ncbi:hypothetical protein RF11_13330 [Thelohanellus kitauei]|uniref:Uncharacterized protein n=1 Tax=Thelohanellus kitauei TaxID=669202 RepID=A0A0C2NK42_THEKT|nr:hypothetical protein RF11_13330 [Thelohanellus kitauei]
MMLNQLFILPYKLHNIQSQTTATSMKNESPYPENPNTSNENIKDADSSQPGPSASNVPSIPDTPKFIKNESQDLDMPNMFNENIKEVDSFPSCQSESSAPNSTYTLISSIINESPDPENQNNSNESIIDIDSYQYRPPAFNVSNITDTAKSFKMDSEKKHQKDKNIYLVYENNRYHKFLLGSTSVVTLRMNAPTQYSLHLNDLFVQ